jgi:hypothetical protein
LEDLNNYQKQAEKQEKSTSVCGLNDGRFEKPMPLVDHKEIHTVKRKANFGIQDN